MDYVRPQRKILRSPSVKRKNKALPVNQRVKLERVLGITVTSNAGLSCDSNTGTVAYPAGCVVVLFNPRRNRQTHIFNASKKTITAVAFSQDGKHLVTGEAGHQPAVRVWDVEEKTQVAEFHGHQFGISCVAFSPNNKEIASVGTQHDMVINVWNWKSNYKVASNKVSSKVSALAFSDDGKCIVTVGNRHVKYWYLDARSKINQTVPLTGRNGILGDQKDNYFCGVVSSQNETSGLYFVITQAGLLCEFNAKRRLDKWVELGTKSANCIAAGSEHIYVGCAEGVVRVFCAVNLHYLCSLPKPHHLGVEVTTATNPSHMVTQRDDVKYPDVMAIAVDDDHKKVTCIYNDRSIYIWDVHDPKRVGKAWSFLYHSGHIWALEIYPQLEDQSKGMLPPGSFVTGSNDDTIRVWNLDNRMPENTTYKRNIYSNELLKIVYSDPSLASLCNVDYNPAGATDKTDTSYAAKSGIRSITVSPDGADLASGDRQGNIRIYDMKFMNEKKLVEAHDSDVMCLEYSCTKHGNFLATASRDRLIHVFDIDEDYGLIQTLGDHSAAISAVCLTSTNDKLRMISCGLDKSILLRNLDSSSTSQFQLEHHLATKTSLYHMVVHPSQRVFATACQDRNVRMYNVQTTKEKKCYRGAQGEDGVLLRIDLDPSGTYAATTCTDKNVCILDFATGELLATMYGHSDVITGIKFANDLKHIITVSTDGCIFIWRLPQEITNTIKGRLLELGKILKDTDFVRSDLPLMPNPVMLYDLDLDEEFSTSPVLGSHRKFSGLADEDSIDDDCLDSASVSSLDYKLSIGQLPNWAKAKLVDNASEGSDSSQEQVQPKGRWASRADCNFEFKSQLASEEDSLLSTPDRRQSLHGNRSEGESSSTLKDALSFNSLQKSKEELNGFGNLSKKFELLKTDSLDLDDTEDNDLESNTTEVIYPPTDADSDLYASSYKVFAVDVPVSKGKANTGSVGNVDDENSESTDPVSLEEDEDTLVISNPPTPSDPDKEFLPRTPEKADFVRENFEDDGFEPMSQEQLQNTFETSLTSKPSLLESTPFSPRLSLSARFMSRAQPSVYRLGSTASNRSDSWFNRNKVEMSKAMDETRKSLLAMNFRSTSVEEVEEEDLPSPPTKLIEDEKPEIAKSNPIKKPEESEQRATPELTSKSLPRTITSVKSQGPAARRITQEKERRRSTNTKPIETNNKTSEVNVVKPSSRVRPTYFKPTFSSKNKTSRYSEGPGDYNGNDLAGSKLSRDLNKQKNKTKPRSRSMLYASTPNLIAGMDDDDDDDDEQKEEVVKVVTKSTRRSNVYQTSNLKKMSEFSKSVPDVNEGEMSTDSSSTSSSNSQPSRRSIFSLSSFTSRHNSSLLDKKMTTSMAAPREIPPKNENPLSSRLKSNLTLDQAKDILQGNSSKLNHEVTRSSLPRYELNDTEVSQPCSTSTPNAEQDVTSESTKPEAPVLDLNYVHNSTYVIEPDLMSVTPSELAVAEELNRTANIIHQQKQISQQSSTNLEASPRDLPERDEPCSSRPGSIRSLPSSQVIMNLKSKTSPLSPAFNSLHSRPSTANQTFILNQSDEPGQPETDITEEQRRSVRERVAQYQRSDPVRDSLTGPQLTRCSRTSSPGRRILPISPQSSREPRDSQSDTGLGSGSDTDTVLSDQTVRRLENGVLPSAEHELGKECENFLSDLSSCISTLQKLKTRFQESSCTEIRSQLTSRLPQYSKLLSDLSHEICTPTTSPQTQKSPQNVVTSAQTQESPQHAVTSTSSTTSTLSSSSSSTLAENVKTFPSEKKYESPSELNQAAIITAARDMLQPVMDKLSHDLSDQVLQLVKEKLDLK